MQVDGEKQVIQPFSIPFQLECSFLNVAAKIMQSNPGGRLKQHLTY